MGPTLNSRGWKMTTRKRQAIAVGGCIVLCAALVLAALFQGMPDPADDDDSVQDDDSAGDDDSASDDDSGG